MEPLGGCAGCGRSGTTERAGTVALTPRSPPGQLRMAEPASPRRGSAPASMLGENGGSTDSLSTLRERYLDGAAKPSTPAPSRERLPDHELPPPGSASQGASLWKEVEQLRRALATAEASCAEAQKARAQKEVEAREERAKREAAESAVAEAAELKAGAAAAQAGALRLVCVCRAPGPAARCARRRCAGGPARCVAHNFWRLPGRRCACMAPSFAPCSPLGAQTAQLFPSCSPAHRSTCRLTPRAQQLPSS